MLVEQRECIHMVAMIAADNTPEHKEAVIDAGAIQALVPLLTSAHSDIIKQASDVVSWKPKPSFIECLQTLMVLSLCLSLSCPAGQYC
jgi:hypothetical protein